MQRFALTLLVGALLVSTSCAASVFQLDVCNKHRTVSEAPGMSLTFTKVRLCLGDASSQLAGGSRHPIIELQHHHQCSCCLLLQCTPATNARHVHRAAKFDSILLHSGNMSEPWCAL
jgi:hypothetical protein